MGLEVYITSQAWLKLWTYIESKQGEIGGMGYAKQEGNFLVWSDTFIMPQVASAAEVDFDAYDGDAYAINKAAEDGVLGSEGFVWVSWHSHGTLSTFWSGTDDKRIESLRDAGISYLLSFVGNRKHEYSQRVDLFNVQHGNIVVPQVTIKDVPLFKDVQDPFFGELFADVDDKVKDPPKKVWQVNQPKTQAAPKQADKSAPGVQLERALIIRELMKTCDMKREDAEEIADMGYTVNDIVDDADLKDVRDGFDSMAWGPHETDDAPFAGVGGTD